MAKYIVMQIPWMGGATSFCLGLFNTEDEAKDAAAEAYDIKIDTRGYTIQTFEVEEDVSYKPFQHGASNRFEPDASKMGFIAGDGK